MIDLLFTAAATEDGPILQKERGGGVHLVNIFVTKIVVLITIIPKS